MSKSKTIGFEVYETIGFSIPNRNFGGHDPETAHRLVREGKGRWALCQGSVLAFVSIDYKLKMWESFLRETPTGFEVTETEYGLKNTSGSEDETVLTTASDVPEVPPLADTPK